MMRKTWPWFIFGLIALSCSIARPQGAPTVGYPNVNALCPTCSNVTPTPSPTPNAFFFKKIIVIDQENRTWDDMFADDATLTAHGANSSLTATLAGFQVPQTIGPYVISPTAPPCAATGSNINVGPGCVMMFTFPLSHIPETWGAIGGGGSNASYDMDHTHGGWQLDYLAKGRQVGLCNYPAGGGCTIISPFYQSLTGFPNTGWGDMCAGTGVGICGTGAAPANVNAPFTTCHDGSNTVNPPSNPTPGPDSHCSPGPNNTGCPSPTPVPPTPTPFPGGSPSPTPFMPGYACGLGFLNATDVQAYWTMAETYVALDNFFQTNQSPSYPSHLYLVSGAAAINSPSVCQTAPIPPAQGDCYYFVNNLGGNAGPANGAAGCDAPAGEAGDIGDIIYGGGRSTTFPCSSQPVIFQQLDKASITWQYGMALESLPYYYGYRSAGLDANTYTGCSWSQSGGVCPPIFTNHLMVMPTPSSGLTDPTPSALINQINTCHLPQVSFITTPALASDHAAVEDGSGPEYVAHIVNAVGNDVGACGYWGGASNTLIILTWDDWGGWYDHVAPTIVNKFEDGFRLPAVCISAYSQHASVDHTYYRAWGTILATIENNFLSAQAPANKYLYTTDVNSAALVPNSNSGCYNQNGSAGSFSPIAYNLPPMKAWGIVATRKWKRDYATGKMVGVWYDKDPKAVERYLDYMEAKYANLCVDECKGNGAY